MSLMNAQDVVDYGSLLDNHPELLSLAIGKRRLKIFQWLLVVEGRPCSMQWLVLDPL
jgi:hypothetical protein